MTRNKTDDKVKIKTEKKPVAAKIIADEDILNKLAYFQEAIINILERKGIICKEDIVDEVKRLKEGKSGNRARRASDKRFLV